jgi:hypothetical protein
MKDGKIRIFLLVLLVAGMVMVPMVNAAANGVQQLPEPPQVPMDEKALKEMQKEVIKELQASTVLDNQEKNFLIKQLKEIWSGKSPLSEAEQQQVLVRAGEVLLQSDSSISPQWSGYCTGNTGTPAPHNDMARIAGVKMGVYSPYVTILYNYAGDPDCWYYSADHYVITGAPGQARNNANQARQYLKSGDMYNGYRFLAYSIHFMSDMSMPFHYAPVWGQQHIAYETYVSANWMNGQYYFNDINKVPNGWYYYITDPAVSAQNLAVYSNYYQMYLVSAMSKPGWQNDPTLVKDTRDCFYQGELYDMGLINYATRP